MSNRIDIMKELIETQKEQIAVQEKIIEIQKTQSNIQNRVINSLKKEVEAYKDLLAIEYRNREENYENR